METGSQRGKIQEESMVYEHKKHDGSYPIIGVNTFRNPDAQEMGGSIPLQRSTEEEKRGQSRRLREFQARNAADTPAALAKLRQTVIDNGNVSAELASAAQVG